MEPNSNGRRSLHWAMPPASALIFWWTDDNPFGITVFWAIGIRKNCWRYWKKNCERPSYAISAKRRL